MAKKSIWIDNTIPPTNYIWAKTDELGNILGIYKWNGKQWEEIEMAVVPDGETDLKDGQFVITGTNQQTGESVTLIVSESPVYGAQSVAVRSVTGTLSGAPAIKENEYLTRGQLCWDYNGE